MNYPETPAELACILHKLADAGAFMIVDRDSGDEHSVGLQDVHQAIEEVVSAIEAMYVGEAELTATQRLCGRLFVLAVEAAVTSSAEPSSLVTIQEA